MSDLVPRQHGRRAVSVCTLATLRVAIYDSDILFIEVGLNYRIMVVGRLGTKFMGVLVRRKITVVVFFEVIERALCGHLVNA